MRPEYQYPSRIRVEQLSFGILVRNNELLKVYSNEWDIRFDDADCYLLFDDIERKLLRIKWGGHSEETSQSICIALRIISAIEVVNGVEILFTLTTPPSFESEPTSAPLNSQSLIDRKNFRIRRRALLDPKHDYEEIPGHRRVSSYASRALKIRTRHDDLEEFLRVAKLPETGLDKIRELSFTQFDDGRFSKLFSMKNLDEVERWLRMWQKQPKIMSWSVAFQLQALMSNGHLNASELLHLRPGIKAIVESKGFEHTVEVLRHLSTLLEDETQKAILVPELLEMAELEVTRSTQASSYPQLMRRANVNDHICGQVTITPTSMRFSGPSPELSNRVLRLFRHSHEYFLRVNFADEDLTTYRQSMEVDFAECLFPEIKRTLNEGINIAGRHFDFLGYSSSALRDHAVWFVAEFHDPLSGKVYNAQSIRASLGDFSKERHYPARYGARMAQAFSATEPSVQIKPDEVVEIDDIHPIIPDGFDVVYNVLNEAFEREPTSSSNGISEERTGALAQTILEAVEESFDDSVTAGAVYPKGLEVIEGILNAHSPIKHDDAPDISEKIVQGIQSSGRQFTDGVGTISQELLDDVLSILNKNRGSSGSKVKPCALQIRFQGYKGMIVLNHDLQGRKLCLRPSMKKFDAPNSWDLEIARTFYYPGPMYLNRPLIMHLDSNGVEKQHFMQLLQDARGKVDNVAVETVADATDLLSRYSLGGAFSLGALLLKLETRQILGFDNWADLHWGLGASVHRMLKIAQAHVLRDFRHHGRIPVPGSYTLVGVADEWDYLEENQIYVCVHDPKWDEPQWIEGIVLVSRSPCIHPGDAQLVEAIGKPPKDSPFYENYLPNVVVFSCKGKRPLPSKLGGGDLDGDLFNIIVDDKLHPTTIPEPAEYPDVQKKRVEHDVTISDVADFVVEYINSDVVGLVSSTHLVVADNSEYGVRDDACIKLAALHAMAVDYPKSGTPVDISNMPRAKSAVKPDWNEGEIRYGRKVTYYRSHRALGELYRAINIPPIPWTPIPARTMVLSNPPPQTQWNPKPHPIKWVNFPPLSAPARPNPQTRVKASPKPPPGIKFIPNGSAKPSAWSKGPALPKKSTPAPAMAAPANRAIAPPPGLGVQQVPLPPPSNLGPSQPLPAPPGLGPRNHLPPPPGLSATQAPSAAQSGTGATSIPANHESILSRMRSAAKNAGQIIAPPKHGSKEMQDMQGAYDRYIFGLRHISLAQALAEPLREEELVVGTIMAKASSPRYRRNLMERMRFLTSRVVTEVKGMMGSSKGQDSQLLDQQLRLSYTAYHVAGNDAQNNKWGASSFCLVALGVFCDALTQIEKKGALVDHINANVDIASQVPTEELCEGETVLDLDVDDANDDADDILIL